MLDGARRIEAEIDESRNVLLALSETAGGPADFFGTVVTLHDLTTRAPSFADKTVYVSGDLSRLGACDLRAAARVFVIDELSSGARAAFPVVSLGRVPVRVGGVGVYYRRFFDDGEDYFRRVGEEHTFQSLTESVKPSTARRTGIYLTPVTRARDELHFHLLRCSTNLSGPTENFCATDRRIVDLLNREAAALFRNQATLNHVLAQIYHATRASDGQKETKARISAHADKTKDMPADGIMAFCTFYDRLEKLAPLPGDPFDHGYKGRSGLTRLQFRRKVEDASERLPRAFSLTLYPNAVFFMPLSTNRLYTHEIQSSVLNAELLPTRLGYVVRCSKTAAVHRDGAVFLEAEGKRVPLDAPTPEGMAELRWLYAEENRSQDFIDYGERFRFSMNQGDYLPPDIKDG